jgi:outer membrane protein TolC
LKLFSRMQRSRMKRGLTASLAFAAVTSIAIAQNASATVKLTPQSVVDLTLTRGYRAKGAELTAQRAYFGLQNALGIYDLQFAFNPQYEYNQAQNIANTGNPLDRTLTLYTSVQKIMRTGTTLLLEYSNIQQNSTLTSSAASLRGSTNTLNAVQLTARQALWQNAFGYANRLSEDIGRAAIESALKAREVGLQTVILDTMNLFWNTYIAQRQLEENVSARDKYVQLVKNVRQKAGYNLSAPGELPRLEAELQGVEQKVKLSSATYLNSLRDLLSAIQLDTADAVELDVPTEIPPVPQLEKKDPNSLRPVQIAKLTIENAQRNLDQVKSVNHPKLDLVAKAKSAGTGDVNNDSLAIMEAGTKPYYFIGFEFLAPFGSELIRGRLADAQVTLAQAKNDFNIQLDAASNLLIEQERTVASQYAIAKSTIETVDLRARVVRDLETAYRQGRQPLVELIRAYNDLFSAQQDRAKAIGQYNIGLNQLAAARDELVASLKR